MDMKKILQALDSVDSKPAVVGVDDMKRFVSVIKESQGPLNRLTQAENIAVYHTEPVQSRKTITSPVMNVAADAKPSMIGKYFKTVEQELAESYDGTKNRARKIAERVVNKSEAVNAKQQAAIAIAKKKKNSISEGYYDLNDPGMQPIDLSSKPSFNEIIVRYSQLYYQSHEGEYDDEEAAESDAIEQYVAKRFGEKGSAHLQKAAETSFFGRDDKPYGRDSRSSNLGYPNQRGSDFRTTKAGKMHGQDAKVMKGKVADRLGKHPEPDLPEQYNYRDIAEMARQGLSNEEIAEQLGFDLTEGLKDPKDNPCWKNYKPVGTKKKNGRTVPNCVPK